MTEKTRCERGPNQDHQDWCISLFQVNFMILFDLIDVLILISRFAKSLMSIDCTDELVSNPTKYFIKIAPILQISLEIIH